MAIGAPTLMDNGKSSIDATFYNTASTAFVAGNVYELHLGYGHGTVNPAAPSSISTATATVVWTLVAECQYKTTSTNRTAAASYVGVCTASGTGVTTISFGYTNIGAIWVLAERTGVDTTTPVRAIGGGTGSPKTATGAPGAGATLSVTLDALASSDSRVSAQMGRNHNALDATCDADWTELHHASQGSPGEELLVAYATAETVFTITNSGSQTNATGLIAYELLPALVGGNATLNGFGSLIAVGRLGGFGSTALSGSGSLGIVGQIAVAGALALSGSGGLVASGTAVETGFQGTASMSGSGSLTAAGSPGGSGVASLTGSGTLAASGTPRPTGVLTLTGSGTLAASGTPRPVSTVALSV